MGAWLDGQGHEQAAVLVEDAWRDVCAVQHVLDPEPA
jgi:hypothetical protein